MLASIIRFKNVKPYGSIIVKLISIALLAFDLAFIPITVVIFKLLSREDYLIKLTFTELSFVNETIPPTGIVSFKLNLCKLKFEPVTVVPEIA